MHNQIYFICKKEMKKVWYWTMEEYENTKTTFRETQKSKPRFYYHWDLNTEWEWEEWTTSKKMTNSRGKLQKEYNTWNKSRYKHDTIYFIV